MTTELAKMYVPADVEPQMQQRWEAARAFHVEPDDPGAPYCIVIPPPNVTSALHLGHALNNTLQDILTRYRRMQGRKALWMPGTDHAGIATQTVVEKRVLAEEGKRRTDFERDAFIARIQAWKDEYEARITEQLKAMGASCDWDRQRFTMDPVCARAVREAFFRLFADGLIYRGKRLVNWDPATQTALADDEVEMQEIDGSFYYMKYPVVDDAGADTGTFVTVATTRPETMLGDTAVAINPQDPRAAELVGRSVRLPIVNRIIPIIADDYVVLPNPESSDAKARFASGFLKVTPAHDPNDYELGRRHNLPMINVMAPDGSISREHGWPEDDFARADAAAVPLGQDRYAARKAIVQWFREHDLLEDVRPYRHSVGHSYRSHVAVEPYLSDQWYVKVTDERLAGAALRAMASEQRTAGSACTWKAGDPFAAGDRRGGDWEGGLRFTPARYARTFQAWHENIRDWCISRQLWWGHRIPVWQKRVVLEGGRIIDGGAASAAARAAASDGPWAGQCAVVLTRAGQPDAIAWDWARGAVAAGHDTPADGELDIAICINEGPLEAEIIAGLEAAGFAQDPDVLDTWFSSALWPMSTMGWPDDALQAETRGLLETFNPGDVLCTAREIITLWVSRMVMFNLYLRNCLPFRDVFIHAMIQDGHGQKMSKSLGNGVDPFDIIHSHGSDAMRYTLASMTTQTQDVKLPVDMICPYTGETFTPKYITTGSGHVVAAPVQACPSDPQKTMLSSYGYAAGKGKPTDEMPLARNSSSKFDLGRNFANKLWNAVRFALGHLEQTGASHGDEAPGTADRWILSRLEATLASTNRSLEHFQFSEYAQTLYDFTWRDLCDWYIEAVKPTIRESPRQRQVLAAVLDVTLRLLHPVMPYVTERLWEQLNATVPERKLAGLTLVPHDLLARAAWPQASASLRDAEVEAVFEQVQAVVGRAREVRTTYKVPPRQTVPMSIKAPDDQAAMLQDHADLLATLANVTIETIGPDVSKADDAAGSVLGKIELYLHGLVDPAEERKRLSKRLEDVTKNVTLLQGRLSNESYVSKAPARLVDQTRAQLAEAEKERDTLEAQLAAMGA